MAIKFFPMNAKVREELKVESGKLIVKNEK
jgi:hypothetical protein